jgi:hypothetical protein
MPILRVPVPGALNGHVNDTDERPLLALTDILLCAADYPQKRTNGETLRLLLPPIKPLGVFQASF